jgi:hypothetical protein
MMKDI